MSDIDDVTTAADTIEAKLPHPTESAHTNLTPPTGFGPIQDRIDQATHEQLTRLMHGGIGEPNP